MPVPESNLILREQLNNAKQEICFLRQRLRDLPSLKVASVLQQRSFGYVALEILDVRVTSAYGVFQVIVGGAVD